MTDHKVVSREDWIEQRKALLLKEKALTRKQMELSQEIRDLPWVKVDKDYIFETPTGKTSLADLFDGSSQLIVYHFMFQPDWTEGCKSCSLIVDHFNPLVTHMRHRDTNMVSISRAPIALLEAFRKRMGWTMTWVSSLESDFNSDYFVYFPGDVRQDKEVYYNYQTMSGFPSTEGPGISVFFKDKDGAIYHTYSCYARGLERFMSIYEYLNIVPKGRDEAGLAYGMEWVRHHDKYGDESFKDIYVELIGRKKSK